MLDTLSHYHLDVVLLALVAAAGGWLSHRLVMRKAKVRLPSNIWILLAATVLLVVALAEWTDTEPMHGARLSIVVLGVLLTGTILTAATLLALARVEVRTQTEAQARLRSAKEISDVRNRAKSEFLAVMSHEIRTPLTAVIGFASVLSETKLDKTQRRYINTVISAGERVVALLNDILDFSKIEEGKLTIERVPFVPALLVHDVMDLLMPRATEKNIVLHFDNQLGSPLSIVGDPTRIRQIVLNLVGNAIKFTDTGSVTIYASWDHPPTGDGAGTFTVRVTDTGIGIQTGKLKSLFKMFTQADLSTARRYGGSGLGLAICHRLVELMEGRIWVESTFGVGSQFTFTIPCPLGHSDTTPPEAILCQTESNTAPPLLGRVLVVDDQQLNRELLNLLLRRHGYQADLAASGQEAVQLARTNAYSVVFMDLEMPDMNGFVTTAQLRAQEPPGRHVPIVAVTANTEPGTREKCLAAGMDDYLTKPVYLPALKSTLEAMTAFQRPSR